MKFKQVSGRRWLYVSQPGGEIVFLPAGGNREQTIEAADALSSVELHGSFWFLSSPLKNDDAESILNNAEELRKAHPDSRLLIWSDRPGGSWEEVRKHGEILRIDNAGAKTTQNCDIELAGGTLRLSIAAGDLKYDPDKQVLQFGGATLEVKGAPTLQRTLDGVTIPWSGAQLGHWQFDLSIGMRELFDVLPCGFRYFIAGDTPDSPPIELRFPLFALPHAEAEPLEFTVTADLNGPSENKHCSFTFKKDSAALPSYLRTRFGHPISLKPTASSAFAINHANNQSTLEPVGEFRIGVNGKGPVELLCGLSGTETIQLENGAGLKFETGKPAFAAGFPFQAVSPVQVPPDLTADLLSSGQRTAWVSLAAPARYSAQPQGNWWYGKDELIHKGSSDLLGAMDLGRTVEPGEPFPLVPYAGVDTESFSKHLEEFERSVLAPTRRKRIVANPEKAPAAPSATEPFNATTAAGFVVTVGADNQWQSIRLGQSGGNEFGFDHPSAILQAAFQGSELFLVLANVENLVMGDATKDFKNAIDFDGWKLSAQVGQNPGYGDYSDVVIVKGRKGKIIELAGNPNAWSDATTFAAPSVLDIDGKASDPDPHQLVPLSRWLQQYLRDAQESEVGELAEFRQLINDDNWTGVLVLQATVTPPKELAGLTSSAAPQRFHAHHFGIAVTPVEGTEIRQSGDSATFGLIQYYDAACEPFADSTPVPTEPGATLDFKLLTLRARFENSAVKQFDCCAQLTINEFFGDWVSHMGDSDNPYNAIMLRSSLQKQSGNNNYVLDSIDDNRFYLDSHVLHKVEIVRAGFETVSSDDNATTSRIRLEGYLDLKRLEIEEKPTADTNSDTNADPISEPTSRPFDLLSFGSEYIEDGTIDDRTRRGLHFSGLNIDVVASKDSEGAFKQDLSSNLSGLVFDPRQSTTREHSLCNDLALEIAEFTTGSGGDKPKSLGYLSVATDAPNAGLGNNWYGLSFRLRMGSAGELAGNVGLVAELLLAWSPGQSGIEVGLKLPGSSDGASVLSLQGMLNLAVGSIRLRNNSGAFVLMLDEIAIRFLGLLKFPTRGATSFYLFGNPSGETQAGKLGWYAVYKQPKNPAKHVSNSKAQTQQRNGGA